MAPDRVVLGQDQARVSKGEQGWVSRRVGESVSRSARYTVHGTMVVHLSLECGLGVCVRSQLLCITLEAPGFEDTLCSINNDLCSIKMLEDIELNENYSPSERMDENRKAHDIIAKELARQASSSSSC